jgi:hydroxymethyl cephem carbamoyltransferase
MLPLAESRPIVAINPGHDGSVAIVDNERLLASYEAEHDSRPRHSAVSAFFLLDQLKRMRVAPSVIATSGWSGGWPFQSASTPYRGTSESLTRITRERIWDRETVFFESTHERSHIFCAYGLSPFPQGQRCYVLVWEGVIGSFYEIDEQLHITELGSPLDHPGYKYSFLYDLAHPASRAGGWHHDNAGKLMALAGLATGVPVTGEEADLIETLLTTVAPPKTDKALFGNSRYLDIGVTHPAFCNLVARVSEAIFDCFYQHARAHMPKRLPLLISGGCGLNCSWNSAWRDCGLFQDVFVPPVANDSGSAIGTAIEAQYMLRGKAKLSWNLASGDNFCFDERCDDFKQTALSFESLAVLLAEGGIIAWVQGRAEIGPRALGHRSLLAAPFQSAMRDRLNAIKQRESYRPIAPVCLEEDASDLFGVPTQSPYMLFFHRVRDPNLRAVTHIDGSARVQTVSSQQNAQLHALLSAFKAISGKGVLCNTSLNFHRKGFINRSSDLFQFARTHALAGVVIDDYLYTPQCL